MFNSKNNTPTEIKDSPNKESSSNYNEITKVSSNITFSEEFKVINRYNISWLHIIIWIIIIYNVIMNIKIVIKVIKSNNGIIIAMRN